MIATCSNHIDERTQFIRVYCLALALVFTHMVLAWLVRPPGIATGHDDSQYLAIAESLGSFSYRDIHLAGAPTHHMYPPGYPALLLLWRTSIAGHDFDWTVLLGIFCSGAALASVFMALYRVLSPNIAVLSLLVLTTNPYLLGYAGSVMSEPPYLLFSVLALCFLSKNDQSNKAYVWATIFALAAMLTRMIGVALLATVAVELLLQRKYRGALVYLLVTVPVVGGWLLWSMAAPVIRPGRSYIADAVQSMDTSPFTSVLLERIVNNSRLIMTRFAPEVIDLPTLPGTIADNLLYLLFLMIGMTLGGLALLRKWRAAFLYIICYAGILVIWPWVSVRFVVPLLPILVPVLLTGVSCIGGRKHLRYGQICMFGISAFVVVSNAVTLGKIVDEALSARRDLKHPTAIGADQNTRIAAKSFFDAMDYIRLNTPKDAIVLSGKPATLFYHTRRQGVSRYVAKSQTNEGFVEYLRNIGADYVLLGHLHSTEYRQFADRLESNCSEFTLLKKFPPATYLFRVKKPDETPVHDDSCEVIHDYRESINAIFNSQ